MKYKRFFIIAMIISQMFFWFYIISLAFKQTPALSYTLFTCFITLLVVSFFLYFITLSQIVENGRTEFQLQILEQEKQLKENEEQRLLQFLSEKKSYKEHILHQLNDLMKLLDSNDSLQTQAYLKKLDKELHTKKPYYFCSHSLLNAIFHEKQHIAESKNIQIEYAISIPEKFQIPQNELASIFFNLLDNAIEACEQSKTNKPSITLKTSFQGSTLSIQMINSKDKDRIFNKKTSKKNKDNHGFGLSIIEDIVHACRGHVTWSDHGETFESVIILEIND